MASKPRRAIEGCTETGNACTVVLGEDRLQRRVLYLHGARDTSLVLTPEITEWLAALVGCERTA